MFTVATPAAQLFNMVNSAAIPLYLIPALFADVAEWQVPGAACMHVTAWADEEKAGGSLAADRSRLILGP